MDIALLGLPLSGTTTLFRALGGTFTPGARGQEHQAIVSTPDERLAQLAKLFQPKKTTHPEIHLHDLPGGLSSHGELPATAGQTLAQSDLLIGVVRAFTRADVPHPQGGIDPFRDIESLSLELAYHDLALIERRLERLDTSIRSAKAGERDADRREQTLLLDARACLEEGLPLRARFPTPEHAKDLPGFGFLTLKPLLVALNIDEAALPNAVELEKEIAAGLPAPKTAAIAICAQLEAELAELTEEDDAELLRGEMGAAEPASGRVLAASARLLDLVTFFTVSEKECRAWQVRAGTTALEAAGKIHSDMERGFIRVEAIQWQSLLETGSLAEARKQGILRTEGKHYPVQDGEVLHILFRV